MPPFTPTASERRGRKRSLAGLVLLLLAAGTLGLTAWPWAEGVAWPAWLRPGAGEEGVEPTLRAEVGGRGVGWWAEALRPQLALVALVLLGLALGTHRRLSAAVAVLALGVNGVVVGSTPVRGGWWEATRTLWAEAGSGGGATPAGGWAVLHAHLAGATHLDALAAEVARAQPEAVTAAGARPGVAQSVTPLLEGYRLAGSRPAAGDDGLAVWVRRDVVSGAARSDGATALAAVLERGEDRLRLVVSTGPPPARPEGEDADTPLLVVGGFDAPPWTGAFPGPAGPGLTLLPPGHARPWTPLTDHAWADLPAEWTAATAAGPPLNDSLFPLHRPLRVRLSPSPDGGG